MRSAKHGLRVLVLGAVVVLGAMALAVSAQAQTHTELLAAHAAHEKTLNPSPLASTATNTPGTFLVNLGAALLATISGRQIGTSTFLIAGRSLEIRCTGLFLTGKINNSTDALLEATFTGCKAFDHKTLVELPCQLKELETIKAIYLVLPILHGGEPFLLLEPKPPALNFTTITWKEGTGCPLPLNNPVTGSFAALVDALDAVTQLVLFSEGIQLLTGDKVAFGGFPSYLKAHWELELLGAHEGDKLGIH